MHKSAYGTRYVIGNVFPKIDVLRPLDTEIC